MTYYCDKNTTPMRFHVFILILTALRALEGIFLGYLFRTSLQLSMMMNRWTPVVSLVLMVVLCLTAFVGLLCRKKYGYIAVNLAYFYLMLATLLFDMTTRYPTGILSRSQNLMLRLAVNLTLFLLVFFYYRRRKPLFDPKMCRTLTPEKICVSHVRCPKCKTRTDRSGFCRACDTQAELELPEEIRTEDRSARQVSAASSGSRLTYYCDKNTAPLLFHKIMLVYTLIMTVRLVVFGLFLFPDLLEGALWGSARELLMLTALILLLFLYIGTCAGLFLWKKFGWIGVSLVYLCGAAAALIRDRMNGMPGAWAVFAAELVIAALIFYYYLRRKPLFYPEMCKTLDLRQISVSHVRCPNPDCRKRTDKTGSCRACGAQAEPVLPKQTDV